MEEVLEVFRGIFKYFFGASKRELIALYPWMSIWEQKCAAIVVLLDLLLLILLVMIFNNWIARNRKVLNTAAYGITAFSFVYLGLILGAQPTTANLVILHNGIKEGAFMLGLFVMEPYIFILFNFMILTMFVWGRGVFCGWICPYGAMLELLNRLIVNKFPKLRVTLPEKVHWKLIYLKYIILAVILVVGLFNFVLAEYLAEVEPFKTFVLKLQRQWYFVAYFLLITAASLVVYRSYCRYICPLGAALGLPSFLKIFPLVKPARHNLCGTCKICGRTCSYQAIKADGRIDSRECLDCLECQVNYWDEHKCPAVIKAKRQTESSETKA